MHLEQYHFNHHMFEKLKQIKDLREQAKQIKDSMGQETVRGEALGGKIMVIMDGNQEITAIDIAPELMSPEHKKEVEDGVRDAIQQAIREVQKMMARKIQRGEISLPKL